MRIYIIGNIGTGNCMYLHNYTQVHNNYSPDYMHGKKAKIICKYAPKMQKNMQESLKMCTKYTSKNGENNHLVREVQKNNVIF